MRQPRRPGDGQQLSHVLGDAGTRRGCGITTKTAVPSGLTYQASPSCGLAAQCVVSWRLKAARGHVG